VLVQLDDEAQLRQLQEERAALSVIAPQLAAVRDQIKARRSLLRSRLRAWPSGTAPNRLTVWGLVLGSTI
jgi:hypothetical protein